MAIANQLDEITECTNPKSALAILNAHTYSYRGSTKINAKPKLCRIPQHTEQMQ